MDRVWVCEGDMHALPDPLVQTCSVVNTGIRCDMMRRVSAKAAEQLDKRYMPLVICGMRRAREIIRGIARAVQTAGMSQVQLA